MTKKKKHCDLDACDVAPVIEEAIRRLPNGDLRLSMSRFPLSHMCLTGFHAPDISEQISSDYSMPSRSEEMAKQFYEEITILETIMEEMNIPNRPDLQPLSRKAYAMQMWDCYAVPWRSHNERIYLIWSPRDLMGSPIIHSYPVSYFLRILAEILEEHYDQAWRLTRHLKYWRIFAIFALIIIGVVVWAMAGKLFV